MSENRKGGHLRRAGWRVLWPIIGFLSLLWFLVRVIPKPSRAAYPCQRAAFPMASAFVLWLLQFAGLVVAVKWIRSLIKNRRFVAVSLLLVVAVVTISISATSGDGSWYTPSDESLAPVGTPQGIYPGRVVWNYNPNATDWDGITGNWHEAIDTTQVSRMLSTVLTDLTGADSDSTAWDLLFRYYNQNHGTGDVGYQANETIVVKLNLNGSTNDRQITAPQLVLSLLRQLVNNAGVDEGNITLFDATRDIPDSIFDFCTNEFPNVHFTDLYGENGREQVQKDLSEEITWSDDLDDPVEIGKSGNPSYLPSCVSEADYFINIANLKGHSLGGITACAKNNFGSFMCEPLEGRDPAQAPKSAGLHPFVAVHSTGTFGTHEWAFDQRAMGTYNPLVDLMGHKDLGGKTVLYLIDGLYAMESQSSTLTVDGKWQSEPFSSDDGWSSSLFASQDPVAIDSVALDFLRSEATIQEYSGVMDAGDSVDNYLHEAAMASSPPSGTFYDPEGDGVGMQNLGVHEHWNNSSDKLYSGNLNPGAGIELIKRVGFPDLDDDGLPDEWELEYYGGTTNADPAAVCSNSVDSVMAAYIAGFDPTDPQACFRATALPNAVSWGGVSGRVYSVYWSSNILHGFQLLTNDVPWTNSIFIDTQHQDEKTGFYKLQVDLANP